MLELEERFPVNEWQYDGIHLWPIIRIKLFFYLIDKVEFAPINKKNLRKKKPDQLKKLFYDLKQIFKKPLSLYAYFSLMKAVPKRKYFFFGADAHRVNYKESRYNRYFDVMIEKLAILGQSLVVEYDTLSIDNHYNRTSVLKYDTALKGYLMLDQAEKNVNVQLKGYDKFTQFLAENTLTNKFSQSFSHDKLIQMMSTVFMPRVRFFGKMLEKVSPEKVMVLCYYNFDVLTLIVAANRKNIPTIEMQHGPMTGIHLAYGSWSQIPDSGYDIMPRIFWCWEQQSKSVIDEWAAKTKLYSAKVIGHPWVDYWKSKTASYPHSDFILYSLQPHPLTVSRLFPPSIINFIKQYQYTWFLRLHPRQLSQLDEIADFLKSEGVYDRVNITDATNDPLPLLLSHCSIHISNFSGSTIEAGFFNVHSVVMHETAVISYADLLSRGMATYIDPFAAGFEDKLHNIIQSKSVRENQPPSAFNIESLFKPLHQ